MKNKNVKIGMMVELKEDYANLLKGEKYRVLNLQNGCNEKYYVLEHDGKNSYLAPSCKDFKPANIVPKKTAVKVNNEFEFNELMKHYKGLGWKCKTKYEDLTFSFAFKFRENLVSYHDNFTFPSKGVVQKYAEHKGTNFDPDTYTIIDYVDFAKENGLDLKPTEVVVQVGSSEVVVNKLSVDINGWVLLESHIESIHSAMQSLK